METSENPHDRGVNIRIQWDWECPTELESLMECPGCNTELYTRFRELESLAGVCKASTFKFVICVEFVRVCV